MNGSYGIPYEELAMQQQEAAESARYSMREVRASLVKLSPEDRRAIILALDSAQAEIEKLDEIIVNLGEQVAGEETAMLRELASCLMSDEIARDPLGNWHWGNMRGPLVGAHAVDILHALKKLPMATGDPE